MTMNVDDEWNSFISHKCNDNSSEDDNNNNNEFNAISEELNSYNPFENVSAPEPTAIYISTKSKIAYLTQPVDLQRFWDIPIIPYSTAQNGVIKKQIKINSKTADELNVVLQRLQKELYYEQHVISHIDNPNGRIKFKDIRKITVGISKKDIMSYRSKKKQAFYNCFVIILRIKMDGIFKEFHVKVFNTGKLEIPGVQNDTMFITVLNAIVELLQPYYDVPLTYSDNSDTVLINSNFNCGFYINLDSIYDILRNKYNIQAIYDPCCSYPGIQCKFYYNDDIGIQTGSQISKENADKYKNVIKVSFMIFRTGSVLIVGMCDEYVLEVIYKFLKCMFKEEFKHICQRIIPKSELEGKNKNKKIRRKIINIVMENTDTNQI